MITNIDEIRISKPPPDCTIEMASFSFLDIETTGLHPNKGARITEVAILKRGMPRYYWVRDNIENYDESFSNQFPILLNYLAQGVVVGHNVGFDLEFIAYELDRLGGTGLHLQYIDTLSMSKKLLPGMSDYRLATLAQIFDITVHGELHTAQVDAEVARALFWQLGEYGNLDTLADTGMKQLSWNPF